MRSLAGALAEGKCPVCRRGDMFMYPVFSKPAKFNVMNDRCPHCDVRLQPEPGFYQGAMYVSYAFTVAVIALVGLVLYLAGNPSEWTYIGTSIGVMLLLVPFNYRFSRIIYLYAFGGLKYNPQLSD